MIFYTFDLSIATKSQVFKIIREMRDEGLTGGIYLWVNQVSKKMYVGSTMNFYARIATYFYLSRITRVILKALKKYGFSSFTLILVFVPKASRELILLLEQHVLDNWVCDYNCQPNASSTGRIMTEESKAKLVAYRKGLKHSEERLRHTYAAALKPKLLLLLKGTKVLDLTKGLQFISMKCIPPNWSFVLLFLIDLELPHFLGWFPRLKEALFWGPAISGGSLEGIITLPFRPNSLSL